MTLRHYVWSAIDGRASGVQECRFLYAVWRPGEWLWVDSNGTGERSTFHRRTNQSWLSKIWNYFAGSRKSFAVLWKNLHFWKKTTPCGKILKISFRKDSPTCRTTSCVQISWNLADRKSETRALFTGQKKQNNRPALPLSLLSGLRPKSVMASSRQYTRSALNFIQIRSPPAEL